MGFKMKKSLTSTGLQSHLQKPLISKGSNSPFMQQQEFSEGKVISERDGRTTLQRTKINEISGQKMSEDPIVDEGEDKLYENILSSTRDIEQMKTLGIDAADKKAVVNYALNKGKNQQNTVVQEKTIDVASSEPVMEEVTETIESLPLFGNQNNYENVNWSGMARGLINADSFLFTGLLGDYGGREYTRTSKDKLLKMSYDKDPQAFEARMRSLYPSMFSAKNRKPAANTRTTQREVSPGTNTRNESEWETVSDETINIDN